jgi:hypothetical protein
MVGNDQRQAGIGVHAPAQAGDRGVGGEQRLRGEAPHREDQLGLDEVDLRVQVRRAPRDLLRLRIAVARRPALEHVADIDVLLAGQVDGGEHVVEQAPGLADERFAEAVLLRARRLAHQQPVGLLVADPEHGLGARLVQTAGGAGGHRLFQLDPSVGLFFLPLQFPDRRDAHFREHRLAPRAHSLRVSTSASSRPERAG